MVIPDDEPMGGDEDVETEGDWRARIETQLTRNEAAMTYRRESIDGLRAPIDLNLEIQAERRAFEHAAAQAAEDARQAEARAAERARTEKWNQMQRAARARRTLMVAGAVSLGVILLVTSLASVALIDYVQTLLGRQQALAIQVEQTEQDARYRSCVTRNAAGMAQIRREQTLAALPQISPAERQVHADSARELSRQLVDCSPFRKVP